MSNEPERDIEKQLREIARQRRERSGAPLELHPATRKLLQGEVARAHFARGMGSPPPRRFWTPRMQWIVGLAAACVVALAVAWPAMFKSGKPDTSRMELAQNTEPPQLTRDKLEGQALAPEPAPMIKSEKEMEVASVPAPTTDATVPAPAAPAGPDVSSSLAKKSDAVSDEAKDLAAQSAAQTLPAQAQTKAKETTTNPFSFAAAAPSVRREAATPPPAQVVASEPQVEVPLDTGKAAVVAGGRGRDWKATAANTPAPPAAGAPFAVQQFALDTPAPDSLEALKKPASATATVLTNFRVEQNGTQLQIIDSDGSVYAGTIATPAVLATDSTVSRDREAIESFNAGAAQSVAKSLPANRAAVTTRGVSPATTFADSYAVNAPSNTATFRLRGTNLTLHQVVEFTGGFLTTNAIVLTDAATNLNVVGGKTTNQGFGTGTNPAGTVRGAVDAVIPYSRFRHLELSNSVLRGRAVIGGTNQVEINAHPAAQP